MQCWIVTEPTRGASLIIEIEHGQYPQDALTARFEREAADWAAYCHEDPDADLSFAEWLESERYTVALIHN